MGVKQNFVTVLISISLMTNDVQCLFIRFLAIVFLPWRSIYSDPVTIL
jgi:NADH:ubiquinone oxidoreductase subunit K